MTIDLGTLRTTVQNAGEAWADGEHIDIITPPTVLELISEIESLRTRFSAMRAGRDSERSRADKNANALERMEQRAQGAEANLEAALNVSRDRLSRLEQAEQAVARVRAEIESAREAGTKIASRECNGSNASIRDHSRADGYLQVVHYVTRALDGDGRRLADDALGGDNNG